ncbi:MAG: hypothetical protein RML45_01975 [Acetobacteraceae bacterium]|nr:hypothetical protein [Acetobacteraceae bacterium]
MTHSGQRPRIGIVVPCYKQPLLADEALASIFEQSGCAPPVVAAVNDGCPMAETEDGLRA